MKIANTSTLSRRSVLAGLAATGALPLIGASSHAATNANPSVCMDLPSVAAARAAPQRAISLRQISEALAAGRPASLDKLTRLDGYIIDADNRDIILYGQSEPDQPDLHIEDFVVALRAAHGKYGVVRDNVNYITNPLISIDPVASIFPRIHALNLRTSDGQQHFRQICATPQPVRIEGMPRNTRLAKVLVDADYRMKMVGQGSVILPIEQRFPSHWEVRLQQWKDATDHSLPVTSSHTRFWFQAGRFSHQSDDDGDTVFLDRAQVVLNDEDQSIAGHSLTATGHVDPVTRAFCCAWSARMEDVYKAEPIWRDMYNIFRHFSIGRIMKDLGAIERANFDSGVLLASYQIPTVALETSLPGLGNFELYVPPGSPSTTLAATNTVCGGVSIGFANAVERAPVLPETVSATSRVLASRPQPDLVSWSTNASATPSPRSPAPAPANRSGAAISELPTTGRFGTIKFQ